MESTGTVVTTVKKIYHYLFILVIKGIINRCSDSILQFSYCVSVNCLSGFIRFVIRDFFVIELLTLWKDLRYFQGINVKRPFVSESQLALLPREMSPRRALALYRPVASHRAAASSCCEAGN